MLTSLPNLIIMNVLISFLWLNLIDISFYLVLDFLFQLIQLILALIS